jgi:hypothetical protein
MTSLHEEFLHYAKVRRAELKSNPQFEILEQKILSSLIKSEWDDMRVEERASFRQSVLKSNEPPVGLATSNNYQSLSINTPIVTLPKPVILSSLPKNDSVGVNEHDEDDDNESVESFASERRNKKIKVTSRAKSKVPLYLKPREMVENKGRSSGVKSQREKTTNFKPGEWVWIESSRSIYNGCPAQIKAGIDSASFKTTYRLCVYYRMSLDSDKFQSTRTHIAEAKLVHANEGEVRDLLGLLL